MQYMNKVFLLIGGNMGDRLQNLHQAITLLSAACGPVIQQSAVYETAAWGKTDQDSFLIVRRVEGAAKPSALLFFDQAHIEVAREIELAKHL